jgi:hypothetical protein
MAEILPFPIVRRQAFILRQALRAADLNQQAGERHIQHQVKCQVDAMRRKGVSEDLIALEARCMESAIRAALWETVINSPGGIR